MSRLMIVEVPSYSCEFRGIREVCEVVRCRECRFRNENCGMGEHKWCEKLNMSTTPNDFCSYGEREDKPQIECSACDTCQLYNSGISCGVEPGVCKREVKMDYIRSE